MTFRRPYTKPARVYPCAIPPEQRRNAVFARLDAPAKPQPKAEIVRSEPYRRLVALLPCKVCAIEGYSQAAHPNTGKGQGMKTDDRECFPLCSDRPGVRGCHSLFDQGAMFSRETRRALERDWAVDTRMNIINRGLWPANLPRWME